MSEREEVKQSECDALKGTCRGREEESDPMTEARGGQAGGRQSRTEQHRRSQGRRKFQGGIGLSFSVVEVQGGEA